jgi:hypothetical protein
MPFPGATRKLEEARALAESLRAAADAPTFRTLFSAFLSAAKAVVSSMRKDGARRAGFRKWHDQKVVEMRQDALLRFVLEARDEDVHEGRHRLLFNTHLERFATDEAGTPPGGYPATIVIGAEGPVWLLDEGKPSRRTVPIRRGGAWTTVVAIHNAPASHRGRALAANDPVTVCGLTVDYLGELVHEAETRVLDH